MKNIVDITSVIQQKMAHCANSPRYADDMQHEAANLYAYKQMVARHFELSLHDNLTLLNIVGYQQTENYTCGPATVMSLLHYYGLLNDHDMNKNTELFIANEMGTTNEVGTSPQQMAAWLQKYGLDVTLAQHGTVDLLREQLENSIPTLVEWIDWGGHWSAVAGYHIDKNERDEDLDTLLLADSSARHNDKKYLNGLTAFNPQRFAAMWFDAQYFQPGKIVPGVHIIAKPKRI